MAIRALVFDAYGTLYDVQSVRSLANDLCGDKGEIITHLWRLKQLEYTWLRTLMRAYEDFWSVTRAALEFALTSVGIEPAPALCEHQAYVAMAASGIVTEDQSAVFVAVSKRLLKESGVEAIMLGGTDLAPVFNERDAEFPLIDCAGIHADAIARMATA